MSVLLLPLYLRMAWSYLVGTRLMPISELRQLVTDGDRAALDECLEFCRPLRPIGGRLPGLLEAPVLEYPR